MESLTPWLCHSGGRFGSVGRWQPFSVADLPLSDELVGFRGVERCHHERAKPLRRSSGGRSYEQVHKPRSCAYSRRGGCLLGTLGRSVHWWWGLLALIKVPRPPRDEPTCWPAGEQSIFSSASLLWPPTTWRHTSTLPSSSHPAGSPLAVGTRNLPPEVSLSGGSNPAQLQTRALGAAPLELGF